MNAMSMDEGYRVEAHEKSIFQSNQFIFGMLILGLMAVALIGPLPNTVGPDELKSVVSVFFVLIATALIFFRSSTDWEIKINKVLVLPFALALYAFTSIFWAPFFPAFHDGLGWLVCASIIFVCVNAFEKKSFAFLAYSVHWSVLIVSIVGIVEFVFDFSIFAVNVAPAATFGNRNFFAEFIAMALPFSFWIFWCRSDGFLKKLISSICIALIFAALCATGARAAIISVVLNIFFAFTFVGVYLYKYPKSIRSVLIRMSGFLLMIVFLIPILLIPSSNGYILNEHTLEGRGLTAFDRMTTRVKSLSKKEISSQGSSFGQRLTAINASVAMIKDNPILGVGAGAWNSVSHNYFKSDKDIVWMAHNEQVQIVAEYGLIGWLAWICLFLLFIKCSLIAYKNLVIGEISESIEIVLLLNSGLAFFIVCLSGLALRTPATAYFSFVLIGCLSAKCLPNNYVILKLRKFIFLGLTLLSFLLFFALSFKVLKSNYILLNGLRELSRLQKMDAGQNEKIFLNGLDSAVFNINRGFEVYPEHGHFSQMAVNMLIYLHDFKSAALLMDGVISSSPKVSELRCDLVVIHAYGKNLEKAKFELDLLNKYFPQSYCAIDGEFSIAVLEGKAEKVVELGVKIIAEKNEKRQEPILKNVVDSTYSAAMEINNIAVALEMLKFKGERWPSTASESLFLSGVILDKQSAGKFSTEALGAFQKSLASAKEDKKALMLSRIPEPYLKAMK